MWGQGVGYKPQRDGTRIIPTRVGTSVIKFANNYICQDHPHACGDKKLSYRFQKKGVGSSPRVWGQGPHGRYTACDYGIIPTRVGTRILAVATLAGGQDHPHACGDKTSTVSLGTFCFGSSPRVWGQEK